jgi:hypothetical protein
VPFVCVYMCVVVMHAGVAHQLVLLLLSVMEECMSMTVDSESMQLFFTTLNE